MEKNAVNMKRIIKKWYEKLGFPTEYDEEFARILQLCTLTPEYAEENWKDIENPGEMLLAFLYRCESLRARYEGLGIGEDILLHTLSDLVIWTNTHYGLYGELGLSETEWLDRHMKGELFRLGRLQFSPATAKHPIPEADIREGDGVIEIHIPEGEPMTPDACLDSIARAKEFFEKYFHGHRWSCYTCHSWLLDDTLLSFVTEGSNIAKFAGLFTVTEKEPSDAALKYIFRWDATRKDVQSLTAKSTLAKKSRTTCSPAARFARQRVI